MGKKKDSILLSIIAILSITGLEAVALFNGINGKLFGVAIALIAGIAGFRLHGLVKKRGG